MTEYTKDDALAFIESLRLTIAGRTGFKWLGAKLVQLDGYVSSVAEENRRLNEFVDSTGARDAFETYAAERRDDDG